MSEIISLIILYLPFLIFIIGCGFGVAYVLMLVRKGMSSEIKPTKAQMLDFGVLVLRWYLAYYMFDYGVGKMIGEQFGVYDPNILNKPLKDIPKWQLAWYLFGLDNTFNLGVGLTQILAAILLVINRTAIVGALVVLPVLIQIFLVDIAFTAEFSFALPFRLAGMIAADFVILYYYKDRMMLVWNNLTSGTTTRFTYKWWVFLMLPVLGLLTDFLIRFLYSPLLIVMDMIRGR